MSDEIETAFVRAYADGVRILQAQKDSRFREAVSFDPNVVGDREFYDQLDAVEMIEVTNRHGDTEYQDTPHRRRMVTMKTFEVADLVDRADRRRLLNDPINPYSRAQAQAANRKIDDIVIPAFDATAKTGKDGSGTAAFDTAFDVAVGTTNLTVKKIRDTRELLEAAENEEDDGDARWYLVCTASQRNGMLGDSEVTSADFNTVRALVDGQIRQYLGMTWLKSQKLTKSGNNRTIFAWVKMSMQLSMSKTATAFMDILPMKRHSIQVRYELDGGATRMDEKGVVRIVCDESA